MSVVVGFERENCYVFVDIKLFTDKYASNPFLYSYYM